MTFGKQVLITWGLLKGWILVPVTDMMEPVAGHSLSDQYNLPDGMGVVVSQSLHLSGYLLNHGRRWHAFLRNVQLHNAKTASGTTVAIADKAKVYMLMPVSPTWSHCPH